VALLSSVVVVMLGSAHFRDAMQRVYRACETRVFTVQLLSETLIS
jgi:hypothetical protein